MKILRKLLIFLFITTAINAQQLGVWRNYANLQKINDAYITEKGLWAVCQGGAFYYSFEDSSFSILNKAEGLSNNLLSSVTLDVHGKVWFGSENGAIDVFNPSTKEFNRIREIYNTNRLSKSINEMYARGDTIFVSSDFGLSLINSNTMSFYESVLKFGNFTTDAKVNSSFKDNLIYASTQFGIAVQKSLSANFSAPESWNTFPNALFQPAGTTNKIVKCRDTLFAATDMGLFYYSGLSWLPKTPLNSVDILDLTVRNDSLYMITSDGRIILHFNGGIATPFPNNSYKKFAQSVSQNSFFVITENGLVNLNNRNTVGYIFPNGPRANLFSDITVDRNGNVYVASGSDNVNLGYYKYDGSSWSNFSTQNNPSLLNNAIFRIYNAPDNTIYMGTWGNGFIRVKENDTTAFTAANTGMIGASININFLVIHGIKTDSKGNLWVVNYWSQAKQPLSRFTPEGVWTNFLNPLDSKEILARELVIDNNDTKWFTVGAVGGNAGDYLYYFNENPLYTSDINGWGRISSEDGLSSSSVKCLAVGRRGELWIGSSDGVNVIEDPSKPKNNVTSVFVMRAQNVNSIAVDALNQKWIGTDRGVFVLSSDGSRLVTNYTSENSPLPSNSITSLAIDNNSGTVYIGTDNGLSSVITNSVNPQENLENMYAYPNPVIIDKSNAVDINISGLVRDTEIKIFTTSGKMINNFPSPGAGMATWDGRDGFGNLVPSGIYLIVAYDKEGNNVGTTKIAIIKK